MPPGPKFEQHTHTLTGWLIFCFTLRLLHLQERCCRSSCHHGWVLSLQSEGLGWSVGVPAEAGLSAGDGRVPELPVAPPPSSQCMCALLDVAILCLIITLLSTRHAWPMDCQ